MTKGKILLLGTNLGDRWDNLELCKARIAAEIGEIIVKSSVYKTAAWGKTDQPDFLNQVVIVDCSLAPAKLLKAINRIEKALGRVRTQKWGERIIDIDILYYDDRRINLPELTIPHPEIKNRLFTLIPLVQVCPNFRDPDLAVTVSELLAECKDKSEVTKINTIDQD